MRISNIFSSPGRSFCLVYTMFSLLSLHLSLINNYMNSTVGEEKKRRGTYSEELRAPPPPFLFPVEKKQLDVMMFVHLRLISSSSTNHWLNTYVNTSRLSHRFTAGNDCPRHLSHRWATFVQWWTSIRHLGSFWWEDLFGERLAFTCDCHKRRTPMKRIKERETKNQHIVVEQNKRIYTISSWCVVTCLHTFELIETNDDKTSCRTRSDYPA